MYHRFSGSVHDDEEVIVALRETYPLVGKVLGRAGSFETNPSHTDSLHDCAAYAGGCALQGSCYVVLFVCYDAAWPSAELHRRPARYWEICVS